MSCSSGGKDGFGENVCCIHGGSPFADGGLFPGDGVNFEEPDRGVNCGRFTDDKDRDLGRGRVEYFRFVGECRDDGVEGLGVLFNNDSLLVRFKFTCSGSCIKSLSWTDGDL